MYFGRFKDSNLSVLFRPIQWIVKTTVVIIGILPFAKCSSGYSDEKGKVTFNGKEITDRTFVVLSPEFAKDSTSAYYKEYALPYVDVATFEAVDEHYAKDKNKVYYCDEYREGQNYYLTKKETITELKNANPVSFVSLQNGYGRDNKHAWFDGKTFAVKDVTTLKSIDRNFAKDTMQAYLNCKSIAGSDGNTFQLIDGNFAKDTNHIYYYTLEGARGYNIALLPCDHQTFEVINSYYSKDKTNVFFLGFTIKDADVSTFTILKSGYAKDINGVYFQSNKVNGVHAATFRVFDENDEFNQDVVYAKDNNSVYVDDKKINDADVVTFKLLGANYGSDGQCVFYKTKLVKNAHPPSFKVYPHDMGNADAEDGTIKFHEGIKVEE